MLTPASEDPATRCALCPRDAVGPCARCKKSVCGDCCELTTGGATTFAVCTACVRRGGATLSPGWRALLGWLALIALAIGAVAALLVLARR
jgi:hypothetical protein